MNSQTQINYASVIQSYIDNKLPMSFWYKYSNPDIDRCETPISIKGNVLLCLGTQYKKYYIDGIEIINQECDVIALDENGKCYNCNSTHGNVEEDKCFAPLHDLMCNENYCYHFEEGDDCMNDDVCC